MFRSEIFFRTTQELEYLFFFVAQSTIFFPEFHIRLYHKNSESYFFFVFLHQNQNIFFSNIGNQNIFRNRPSRNKNCLWQPCLLMDLDKISKLYRAPARYVSYKVSVHLAKQLQRRRVSEIEQSETNITYGGHICLRMKAK